MNLKKTSISKQVMTMLVVFCFLPMLFALHANAQSVSAFPGAEGFGKWSE